MSQCPFCHNRDHQVKAGKNESGSQRYKCNACQRRYTPQPSQQYSDAMRQQAVKLAADGLGLRQIGRQLGVDHVTVMHWLKAHTAQLPPAPVPDETPLHIVEMDELFTFVGKKKTSFTS